jgi:L-threonylcarbamoyladenylate synthase
VLTSISGDSGCVGLRVPSHPVALALLSRLGDALAAPSANISGQLSPTTANSVRQQLGDRISLILEEDSCAVGIESTVIDMTGISPVIRRLGAISVQAIEQALGKVVAVEVEHEALEHDPGFIMKWVENTRTGRTCSELDDQTAILAHSPLSYTPSSSITWISLPSQPIHYQRCVYQQLSQLKHQGYHTVLIERLPLTPEWESMTACLNRWCKSGILAQ